MRSAERYTPIKDLQSQKLDTIIGRLGHSGAVIGIIEDYDIDSTICGYVMMGWSNIDLLKNQ